MHKRIFSTVIAGLAMAWALPSAAQDEEPSIDGDTTSGGSLRSVRRTKIIDARNFLFFMRGGGVYHNILPRRCNGLAREDRFSYKTSFGRLCKLDHITILYNDPFGMREGISCSLGTFHKITEEDAEALLEQPVEGPQANPLPLPEPEEVDDEDEESADPETARN